MTPILSQILKSVERSFEMKRRSSIFKVEIFFRAIYTSHTIITIGVLDIRYI
jgi:hypothetical protein